MSPEPGFARGGGDITVVSGNTLVAESGPLGTMGNIDDFPLYQRISLYTVREGDTLTQIAKMYGISVNTIVWANSLSGKSIQLGQTLTILPISGIAHTAGKGDTLKSIAKKYKTDVAELALFNDLSEDSVITEGVVVTIPEGETVVVPAAVGKTPAKATKPNGAHDTNGPEYPGYYLRPTNGIKTQGLHGYNGIDIGSSIGTPIRASAAGDVIISRNSGWNGGYGNYVVISHSNGTQTLYAHMKQTVVSVGERISQGDIIGSVGSTGNSTGPHIHFEIRGAHNPF
ncbi:MAG: M23 family metallopeptidase [bacterium]